MNMDHDNNLRVALFDQLILAMEVDGPISAERAKNFIEDSLYLFDNRRELVQPSEDEVKEANAYAESITKKELRSRLWEN